MEVIGFALVVQPAQTGSGPPHLSATACRSERTYPRIPERVPELADRFQRSFERAVRSFVKPAGPTYSSPLAISPPFVRPVPAFRDPESLYTDERHRQLQRPPRAESSAAPPIISLQSVCKSFGEFHVLRGVDLEMRRGERVAIIGPSGTGKSTVLKIIAGLMQPDGGDLFIGGERRDPNERRSFERDHNAVHISMVFQNAALFDSLTVGENVGFALAQHTDLEQPVIDEVVARNLAKVGLPGTESKYPAELSGGMRKRVSIARAITTDPHDPTDSADVILWDEPTAGLDPIASTRVEDLMNGLHADLGNALFVVVTHQESTLRRTADRIVFLHAGRIQWSGTVQEFDVTDNAYVRQFREASLSGPMTVAD